MTRKNMNYESGYTENQLMEELEAEYNEDETNDFDLRPDKKPALSTMKTNLKLINRQLAATIVPDNILQQFDKLKMWVDLNKHDIDINFLFNTKESNMIISDNPEKPDTWQAECKRLEDELEEIKLNGCKQDDFRQNINKDEKFIEFLNFNCDKESNEEYADIPEEEIEYLKKYSKRKRKYPNCKIAYSSRTHGLINVYIKNDILFINLTGKFMWRYKKIDYLTKNNIDKALEKVCSACRFNFDFNKFIELAGVYLCDVCIDLHIYKIDKYINAISSLFPLASSRSRIMKFGTHGLKLKSNAKNAGSSLTFYAKGKEIRKSLAIIAGKNGIPVEELLEELPDDIDELFRIEVQMYSLHDIRALLDIPKAEDGLVKLTDVLNSNAMPILKRFEAFDAAEEKLKEKIALYIDRQERINASVRKQSDFLRLLAAERIAELINQNNYDLTKTKAHLLTEYEFCNEDFIKNLISKIKDRYWDFLLYRKPKAIKIVIDLLNKIYSFYGQGVVNG